jgi:hypothetical protein
MVSHVNGLKIMLLITTGSYFAYALYWFVKTIPWIAEISTMPESYSPPTGLRFTTSYSVANAYLMEYSSFLGLMIRVIGASYALFSAFLFFKNTNLPLLIRDKVSKSLLLEGIYFLTFTPAIYFLLSFSALPPASNILLSAALSIQILLISPMLLNLGFKLRKYEHTSARASSLIRLAGFSSMNYIIALWATHILKWVEMMAVDPYLFSALSYRVFGFLNTLIVGSITVIFAVRGALTLRRSTKNNAIKWWAASLISLSVHTMLYVIYCFSVGIKRFIVFGELWAIPLIGLGAYLLLKSSNKDQKLA